MKTRSADWVFRYYFLCKRGIYQPPLIRITHGQMAKELNIALPALRRTAYAQWLAVMDDKQSETSIWRFRGWAWTYISTESTKEMIPNRR